jgi:hypothetical protein
MAFSFRPQHAWIQLQELRRRGLSQLPDDAGAAVDDVFRFALHA